MKQKMWLRMISLVLLFFMALYNPVQNAGTVSAETEAEAEEGELKENSWRYRDGEPITRPSSRSGYRYAWEKVDGYYRNSNGDIITGAVSKGIDVSHHNETIDWEKVKADGIEFAIIRCGYGDNVTSQDDRQWARNVSECERLGIPYGVYIYSYADSVQHARSEAEHVIRLLEGHSPSYPVYLDMEDDSTVGTSASLKGQIAQAFCDTVSSAGYRVGSYAN